jgi:exosortase
MLLGLAILLTAVACWAVLPNLQEMAQRWGYDATYSHGYIVPLFALFLLWRRRHELAAVPVRPSWIGVLVIAAAGLAQFVGSLFFWRWLMGASLLVYLAGIALLLGGARLLRLTWPAIAFLVFMIPLPFRAEAAMRDPLRHIATVVSTFLLQLLGLAASREGNVIILVVKGKVHELGVAEACSGLAMLITFFALATGFVLLVRRPLLDKLVILASAAPIAVLSNVLRITATGVLYATLGPEVGHFVYHDLAGFLMMPLGIALMWLEMTALEHLLVERASAPVVALAPGLPRPAAPAEPALGRRGPG